MPKKRKSTKTPRRVSTLKHEAASPTNIPTAEFEAVLDPVDQDPVQVAVERRNRDLDPQLVWHGKEVPGPAELMVQAPPLCIQEKVTTPKAEIDRDAWATLHSDTSRAFARPPSEPHRRQGHQPPRRRGHEGL